MLQNKFFVHFEKVHFLFLLLFVFGFFWYFFLLWGCRFVVWYGFMYGSSRRPIGWWILKPILVEIWKPLNVLWLWYVYGGRPVLFDSLINWLDKFVEILGFRVHFGLKIPYIGLKVFDERIDALGVFIYIFHFI